MSNVSEASNTSRSVNTSVGNRRGRMCSYDNGCQFGGWSGAWNRLMCEHYGRSRHTKNTC